METEKLQESKKNTVLNFLKNFFFSYPIVPILIVMIIITIIVHPNFLSKINFINTLTDASVIGIIGVGMTFVIIAKGIDLSIGSTMALTSVGVALLYTKTGLPIGFSIVIALLIGMSVGLVIGLFVTKLMIPPFIASLAAMFSVLGVARLWSGGQATAGLPDAFNKLWMGQFLGIAIPIWIWLGVIILGVVLERNTSFGKYCYAIGVNPTSAHYTGVPVHNVVIKTFMLNGLLAGFAGILSAARFGGGEPLTGRGYEFLVITAVVVGGVNLLGGSGRTTGCIIGALVIAFVRTIMSFWGLRVWWQNFGVGVVLILMVWFSITTKKE